MGDREAESPAGVNEAMQLAEYVARGPFAQEVIALRAEVSRLRSALEELVEAHHSTEGLSTAELVELDDVLDTKLAAARAAVALSGENDGRIHDVV